DTQWSEVDSTRRLVTYTNLDPGSYVFRVTGSNGSGIWNPAGRALTLIISPPWWGTLWFRIFGAATIAGGLLVAYLWRVRSLQAISIGAAEAVAAIDELHDLTRLAAGSPLPLQLEPVDLVALVRQLVAARQETSRHDVKFVSNYATLTGLVDRARLARMLDNL